MWFFIRSLWRILLPPLNQKIPIARKLLMAVRHLMQKNILITDSVLFSDRSIRLIAVILNPEIIGQLLRCRHGREIKKAAGEINHITIRLAPKAMKSCVNLHAWILVIVKWAPAHTLHSANLYQIFTYVKNRDMEFGGQPHEVSGMLLYAKTDEMIQPDNIYQMSGNQISVKTLDLNQEFSEIAKQLNAIVSKHFGAEGNT